MQLNIVTCRFLECIECLKNEGRIKSYRQFSIKINFLPQSLNQIIKGKRNVTIELLRKSIETFNVNPNFLYKGEYPMILDLDQQAGIDNNPLQEILHVPLDSQIKYAADNENEIFDSLPRFTLPDPRFCGSNYRSFDVSGDRMEPTLFNGDRVVCSFIDPIDWKENIVDGFVYVIVTNNDLMIFRINNYISQDHTFELVSDNEFYEARKINVDSVKEIWQVQTKISPFMPSPKHVRNGFSKDLDTMRLKIMEQSDMIHVLNGTIERLLKQSRSTI